jgi:hypothetical protein
MLPHPVAAASEDVADGVSRGSGLFAFFPGRSGMAVGGERRKLLCGCGKPVGIFTFQGFEVYCRFCKETTTVPFSLADLRAAITFVERRRRQARRPEGGPRIGQSASERLDIDRGGR